MENIVVISLLVVILGGAGRYIYKNKKMGEKCMGCPCAKTCKGSCRK